MRISLITGLNNESPVESCIRDLTQVRDEGFARLWVTQMPYDVDLLTVLAAALREVPDVEVASGVVPIQNQHPTLLAQRALTLNIIGDGRFTLGIGVTHRAVTEGMWGISWDRSVKRLSEYLDGLLPLLAKEPVDASGELVTTRGALQIPHAPTPQVYVAALGPQMLRVAGRRTSGTITWMTGPKTLREHVGPTLRAAAADAGRADGSVAVAAALPVSVTDDVEKARSRAARTIRDVRPPAVLSRDARPRGLFRPGRRRIDRRRVDGVAAARRAPRRRRGRVRLHPVRPVARGRATNASMLADVENRPKSLLALVTDLATDAPPAQPKFGK